LSLHSSEAPQGIDLSRPLFTGTNPKQAATCTCNTRPRVSPHHVVNHSSQPGATIHRSSDAPVLTHRLWHTRLRHTMRWVVPVLVCPLLSHSLPSLPLEAKLQFVTISPTIVTMKPDWFWIWFWFWLGLLTRFFLTRLLTLLPNELIP
jgi:hypothetical protein